MIHSVMGTFPGKFPATINLLLVTVIVNFTKVIISHATSKINNM